MVYKIYVLEVLRFGSKEAVGESIFIIVRS